MTNNKKSLVLIKVVDAFGYAIPKAQYQVKNQKTGQVIAAGATNSAGCIVEISRDKGTVLDVYIKSMFNGLMLNVKSFTMSKDRMLVTVASPKILLDLKTLTNQGSNGAYRRKTHTVKKGETLTSIAQQYGTTVRALERLNKIDEPDKINVSQVIKLPVNIPATGNKSIQEKSKPKPATSPKPSSNSKPQPSQKNKTVDVLDDYTSKAKEWLNEVYEDGKEAITETVDSAKKILTVEDRSQESGTPKASAPNMCKTNPQCISSGKSELIREVNIRLAGFGGALPTDEFTELTANSIKQFQRDYMGVPETGKICGSVLAALDKFRDEYGISPYYESMKCPCKKCTGFGKGRKGEFDFESKNSKTGLYVKVKRKATEHPGMHKSLIWGLKAMFFYFKNKENKNGYKISLVSSGYRCTDNNKIKRRATTNHMGNALDLQILNKNNSVVSGTELENIVRKEWFCKYLNTQIGWQNNKFGLEGLAEGAKTWVHLDVREFNDYKGDNYYSITKDGLNGDYLLNIAKNYKAGKALLGCSGNVILNNSVLISDKSLEELIKMLGDVISHGEGKYDSYNTGTKNVYKNKVGFSFLNPLKGTVTSKTINEIIQSAKTRDGNDKKRLFATGKYQTTYYTLQAGIDDGFFTGKEIYNEEMQEKVFRDFLLQKRSKLYNFVINGRGTLIEAQYDSAQEWASIGVPKGKKLKDGRISDGFKSYYEKSGQNSSSNESTKMVVDILNKIKIYHENKGK